jgi:predicted transposase YdaD
MIRQRNRAIQRLCKLLSTNTEAHVQAHIIVVENLIKYHKTNVVLKPSRSELRAVCASPFKQLLLHVTFHRRRRSRPLHCMAPQRRSWMCPPRGR